MGEGIHNSKNEKGTHARTHTHTRPHTALTVLKNVYGSRERCALPTQDRANGGQPLPLKGVRYGRDDGGGRGPEKKKSCEDKVGRHVKQELRGTACGHV